MHWPRTSGWIGLYLTETCRCGYQRLTWMTDTGGIRWVSDWGTDGQPYRDAMRAAEQPL
jgi:hypothetical protein